MGAATAPEQPDQSHDPIASLQNFLASEWDPDLSVGEWWHVLGESGWAAPSFPRDFYGRGISRSDAARAQREFARSGALPGPGGLGLLLAGPTICDYGTLEQKQRYLPEIVTGRHLWCQLFSEPSAGSDLAAVQTRARRDGNRWLVTGQKVWTSLGRHADMGMLIARTDFDVPKTAGISYFLIDMRQPGVDVRPLREMTGRSAFVEVFFDDAVVEDGALLGHLGQGWEIAKRTLTYERAGVGAGGGSESSSVARPGTHGHLQLRAGDFVGDSARHRAGGASPGLLGETTEVLIGLAKARGRFDDPRLSSRLMRLRAYTESAAILGQRASAMRRRGASLEGAGNISKLAMGIIIREARDLALELLGLDATLGSYTRDELERCEALTSDSRVPRLTEFLLYAPAVQIYGGTDEIQKNLLADRVLGLPREPDVDRDVPFRDVRKNG